VWKAAHERVPHG